MRERGFAFGFIWACPPSKGDDYILHCKPESQKTPNNTRLQKWYQDMLDISEDRGLIYSTVRCCLDCLSLFFFSFFSLFFSFFPDFFFSSLVPFSSPTKFELEKKK